MNKAIKFHMQNYNELIIRYKKAEKFYENEDIPLEQKEKFIPDMKILINNLGGILQKLDEMGQNYTNEEVLEGFKEV